MKKSKRGVISGFIYVCIHATNSTVQPYMLLKDFRTSCHKIILIEQKTEGKRKSTERKKDSEKISKD